MDDASKVEGTAAPAFNIATPASPPAELPDTAAASGAAAEQTAADPAELPRSWVKLLKDVDGVGRSGRVVQASAERLQALIDIGDAEPASAFEVALATPSHAIILED